MEPLGYELSDPRLVPTAGAFAEGLVEAHSSESAGYEVRIVAGVEPGKLETASIEPGFAGRMQVSLRSPVQMGIRAAMGGERVVVLVAGMEPLLNEWSAIHEVTARKLDVKIAQLSGGMLKGDDDPNPPVTADFGLMQAIPRLPLISPADRNEARAVARWCFAQPGAAYIRLSTMPGPVFSRQFIGFNYGIATTLTRQGWDVTLLGNGPIVGTLVRSIEDFELEQISVRVMNVSTLRPLDRSGIVRAAQDTRRLIAVEEHNTLTGLGAAVARSLASDPTPYILKCVGLPDEHVPVPPPQDPLRYYGMRADDIRSAVRKILAEPV